MTDYNAQYYVLKPSNIIGTPALEPTDDTAARKYDAQTVKVFSKPLSFVNSRKEEYERSGTRTYLPNVLFDSPNIVVVTGIKEALELMPVEGVSFLSAIYIDDVDEWHENYWFLNIRAIIDCWDRDASVYDADEDEEPIVDKYSLVASVLDAIPESERLLFLMDGTALPELFVHQKIIDYFEEAQVTGWRAFKVSDYTFGMEF